MGEDKIQDLLLQLISDISYIKAKIDNIEAQQLGSRMDALEAQNANHEHSIRALENRASAMEQFTRNNMNDSKKQMVSVYVSIGLALFSAILSFVMNSFR